MKTQLERLTSSRRYFWVIMALMAAAHGSDAIGRQGLFALSPFFKPELGLSQTQVGLFATAVSLGGITTPLLAGFLVDRFGMRVIMTVGLAVIGIFIAVFSFSPFFWFAFGALYLYGLGHGFINPATTKAIVDWVPARLLGTGMGVKQMGFPAGGALAASILPVLALAMDWRRTELIVGLVLATLAVANWIFVRDREFHRRSSTREGVQSSVGLGSVLRLRGFLAISLVQVALTGINTAAATHFVLAVGKGLGYSVVAAGNFFALAQASGAVGRVLWGAISDTLYGGRRKPVVVTVCGLAALSTFLMGFVASSVPPFGFALIVILVGLAGMGHSGITLALLGEIVPSNVIGKASGLAYTFSGLGWLVLPPAFGYIVDRTGSFAMAWQLLTAVGVIGLLIAYYGVREAPSQQSEAERELVK